MNDRDVIKRSIKLAKDISYDYIGFDTLETAAWIASQIMPLPSADRATRRLWLRAMDKALTEQDGAHGIPDAALRDIYKARLETEKARSR